MSGLFVLYQEARADYEKRHKHWRWYVSRGGDGYIQATRAMHRAHTLMVSLKYRWKVMQGALAGSPEGGSFY